MVSLRMGNNVLARETQALRPILRSAVGDWGVNTSRLRLRRVDDDFEKEFEPIAGRYLDTTSMREFFEWNMLDGGAYRDYLYDIPLGVDSNDDGVSDGWTKDNEGGITSTLSIEENTQKINITESLTGNKSSIFKVIPIVATEMLSLACEIKLESSNIKAGMFVSWYSSVDGTTGKIGNSTVLTDTASIGYFTLQVNGSLIAPATTQSAKVIYFAQPTNIGNTGSAYFKNAKLVKNSFIENIGLLTEDDDSDGVANGWTYTTSSAINPQKSVSASGQRLKCDGLLAQYGQLRINTDVTGIMEGKNVEFFINYDVVEATGYMQLTSEVRFYNSSDVQVGSTNYASISSPGVVSSGTKTYQLTPPAGAVKANLRLLAISNNADFSNSSIDAYLKDVTLKQMNNSVYISKVFDKSGKGNHAIQTVASSQPRLVNEGVFEVMSNGSYTINAQDDARKLIVANDSSLNFTTDFTLVVKLRVPSGVTSGAILGKWYYSSAGYDLILSPNPEFVIRGTSNIAMTTSTNIADDAVHVLTFVCTNTSIKYYLDGVLVKTQVGTWTPTIQTRDLVVFNRNASASSGGAIIDISNTLFLNKALSQTQVALLTNRLGV